jgi:hypothetical protein
MMRIGEERTSNAISPISTIRSIQWSTVDHFLSFCNLVSLTSFEAFTFLGTFFPPKKILVECMVIYWIRDWSFFLIRPISVLDVIAFVV